MGLGGSGRFRRNRRSCRACGARGSAPTDSAGRPPDLTSLGPCGTHELCRIEALTASRDHRNRLSPGTQPSGKETLPYFRTGQVPGFPCSNRRKCQRLLNVERCPAVMWPASEYEERRGWTRCYQPRITMSGPRSPQKEKPCNTLAFASCGEELPAWPL